MFRDPRSSSELENALLMRATRATLWLAAVPLLLDL